MKILRDNISKHQAAQIITFESRFTVYLREYVMIKWDFLRPLIKTFNFHNHRVWLIYIENNLLTYQAQGVLTNNSQIR